MRELEVVSIAYYPDTVRELEVVGIAYYPAARAETSSKGGLVDIIP